MNDADALRTYLSDRDVPCPGCGYSLRGLLRDRCPECNQPLVLAVRLAEPKMVAWIAGLVGLCMGAGFSGLLLAYAIVQSIFYRNFTGSGEFFLYTGVPFAIELPILVLWVTRRRRVMLWPVAARASAAVGAWLLTLTAFVVFTAGIR